MSYLNATILSWTVFLPLIGAVALLLARSDGAVRRIAFGFTLATFLLSWHLPFHFDSGASEFQFMQRHTWIDAFHIQYLVGVDGISLWLVVLTTLLTFVCVLVSWKGIQQRTKAFYLLLLVLETGLIGVFVSLDLFLFYVFWEVSLVPMAFLIGIWGHERRLYAAVKFFLYTMVGSVLMLGAILWLYNLAGTFDYPAIHAGLASGALTLSRTTELWLFLGFFIAFAIKVPLFPFHTWLPDAHVEAPTAGSVLLAGVLLKLGPYGMLRFNLSLFPHAAAQLSNIIVILGLIGIVYGALVAFAQSNMKKLVAYSSVSHMGFIIVGVFTFTHIGMQGAVFQMLAHGISTGGLFILVGMLYERRHTFELSEYGGLATVMPLYATFFVLIVMSSAGLPLLNGFVGEFLIMVGGFQHSHTFIVIAATGVIWGALYLLHWTRKTIWGELDNPKNKLLADADRREIFVLACMGLIALFMGVASPLFLNKMETATAATVAPYTQSAVTQARPPVLRNPEPAGARTTTTLTIDWRGPQPGLAARPACARPPEADMDVPSAPSQRCAGGAQ